MGKHDGFLDHNRQTAPKRSTEERIGDNKEFVKPFTEKQAVEQATRCMDCGVPFCHQGCPLGNQIPDFNEAVHEGQWKEAYDILASTNNFPEFTGRICPAPCESSCVLAIQPKNGVTIEELEKTIIERAFVEGWVQPKLPKYRTGKRVAIIGSGPAGLAAAAELNQVGHAVTVFERDDRIGGLLRYGIPDFKLQKDVITRRLEILEQEGVVFKTGVNVGVDITLEQLRAEYDALLLAVGATVPRDLTIPGRESEGVHYAMEYLTLHNQRVAGDTIPEAIDIHAKDKHVIVIGGGDTGSDCVGTANRQGAKSITQLQYRPAPGDDRPEDNPWPEVPMIYTESSSQEEGCDRQWRVLNKEFETDPATGKVTGLRVVELEWTDLKNRKYRELPGSSKVLPCDLAFIAIGYQHPENNGLLTQLGLELDGRGMIKVNADMETNVEGVFSAGDAQRGQSLVVWALADGRKAARSIDSFLTGSTQLSSNHGSLLQMS